MEQDCSIDDSCHITRDLVGVPLESHQIVLSLVSSIRTNEGLEVHCRMDSNDYPKGCKITDSEMSQFEIKRNAFPGDWNYAIKPRSTSVTYLWTVPKSATGRASKSAPGGDAPPSIGRSTF